MARRASRAGRLPRLLFLSALVAGAIAGPVGPARAHGDEHEDPGRETARPQVPDEADEHAEGTGSEEKAGGARTVEIHVSEDGFNGETGPLRVRVSEGEPVVLRFVYGDTAHGHENTHVIELVELGLKTGRLDAANTVQELGFTPEQSGTFTFRCVYLCHGHANLQQGILNVGPATTLGTELVLGVRSQAGAGLVLMATVRDTRGRPVSGAPLHFLVESSLFDEMMDVGEGVTDGRGEAMLPYTPTVAGPTMFEARFEGQDVFEASRGTTEYRVTRARPGPLIEPSGLRIPGVGTWMIPLLVAGVWLTYAYALSRLRRFAGR